jgi:hypothetical protein
LWLIRNVSNLINQQSWLEKILPYCMATAYGAEQTLDSAPETEYALQADGTVLITPGKPPKTSEQLFREGQRAQFELETGGGPLVQDCTGSLSWFGTWHDQPMPSDEKFMEIAAKAKADVDEIDKMLDPRLSGESSEAIHRAAGIAVQSAAAPLRSTVTDPCCCSK